MDEPAAVRLLDRAMAHPRDAFETGERALSVDSLDDAVRCIVLRAMGIAARSVRDAECSIEVLQRAVEAGHRSGRTELVAGAELTLAGSFHLAGRAADAFAALDRAGQVADESTAATVRFQRATILAREGRSEEAVVAFDDALQAFELLGDAKMAASTLGNRGMAHLDCGRATAAERDLVEARVRFAALDMTYKVATTDHNLGRVAGRRGDVVMALERFDSAEEQLRGLGEGIAEIQANRLEVLLEAGLFAEAASIAAAMERSMSRAGLELERAEAALSRSLAFLGQEQFRDSAELARRAAALFAEQQRTGLAEQARLVAIRAQSRAGEVVDTAESIRLARVLAETGHRLAAVQAWAVVAAHDPELALRECRGLDVSARDTPLEVRLARLEISARAAMARGDVPRALRLTRQAVDVVRREQFDLAAADVRAGMSAQLDAIAQLGLDVRTAGASAWSVVRWVDATHGGSGDIAQATSTSPAMGDLLSELRAVHVASRRATPSDELRLLAEQARLQRRLAAAARATAYTGRPTSRRLPRRLRDRTIEHQIVQYHRSGARLRAVLIDGDGPRLVDVAALGDVDREVRLLRAALLRALRPGDAAVREARRRADGLASMLLPRLAPRPTVVVPLARHMAVPWSLLAPLDVDALSVAPTLRHWMHAADEMPSEPDSVAVVAGVDLASSRDEVARVRAAWTERGARVSSTSTVDEALESFVSAEVVHVAAHCTRREGAGRFAQLRLDDGDVTAFDLERLRRAPSIVTLSACEAGLVDSLPGEESTGIATALFDRGASTVIASTLPLPDTSLTSELFAELHELMATGMRPAHALSAVQRRRDGMAGLVAGTVSCFGRG